MADIGNETYRPSVIRVLAVASDRTAMGLLAALDAAGYEVVSKDKAAMLRPYPEGTPLIAVSESDWEEARTAECEVPELQDALANANAHAEGLPERIAAYLLTHVSGAGGSEWQEGHDYAMTEAARLVRERWFDLPDGRTRIGQDPQAAAEGSERG